MMIEYVYYDTWLMWDPGIILVSLTISSVAYLVLTSNKEDGELNVNVARPRWIASLPSVASVFWLGLYCIIPILTYIMISYWMDRLKAKRLHQ
jgi:hypothetical protein